MKKIEELKSYTGKTTYAISIKEKRSINELIDFLILKKKDEQNEKEKKWTP